MLDIFSFYNMQIEIKLLYNILSFENVKRSIMEEVK